MISPLCTIYLLNRVNRKKFLLPIPSSIHRIICFIDKNSLVAPNKKIKESTFVEDKHPFFQCLTNSCYFQIYCNKSRFELQKYWSYTTKANGFSKIDLTFVEKNICMWLAILLFVCKIKILLRPLRFLNINATWRRVSLFKKKIALQVKSTLQETKTFLAK